jgi:hypothetical protein
MFSFVKDINFECSQASAPCIAKEEKEILSIFAELSSQCAGEGLSLNPPHLFLSTFGQALDHTRNQ